MADVYEGVANRRRQRDLMLARQMERKLG